MHNTGRGVVFRRALRDWRGGILGWGVGFAALAAMVGTFYPLINTLEGLNEVVMRMLENPLIRAFAGDVEDMTSAEGFLATKFFTTAPLILAIYMVTLGLSIVAGEEERGTLDILLSTPVPRWRVVVEKFAALGVAALAVLGMCYLGLVGIRAVTPELQVVSPWRLAEGVLSMLPALLLMAALTLLLSTVLRSRAMAGGVAAGIIVGSYFVSTLASLAPEVLGALSRASLFSYYRPQEVLRHGMAWGDFVLLSAVAALFFGLGVVFFQRRDVLG